MQREAADAITVIRVKMSVAFFASANPSTGHQKTAECEALLKALSPRECGDIASLGVDNTVLIIATMKCSKLRPKNNLAVA